MLRRSTRAATLTAAVAVGVALQFDGRYAGHESLDSVGRRLGLHGAWLAAVWSLVAIAVGWAAGWRARRYRADGQWLLAAGVVGCAIALLEPSTRAYGMPWLALTATGRLGRRRQDRGVWPLVAVVPLVLPTRLLNPHIDPVSSFVLSNSACLLAVAVCTCIPFLATDDPSWHTSRPSWRRTRPHRIVPLLPPALRGIGRPNLLLELFVVQVGYGFYTWIRNVAPDRSGVAISHGQQILNIEQFLHVDVEGALNRFALRYDWLEDALEHYYKTLHFVVPLVVLGWLYWRHPEIYRRARALLFLCTGLALIGYWAFPLAPPRLTPGHGFRDTLHPGADADPFGAFTKLANQFAAMPSLHVSWSTWSAVVIVATAPYLWVRVLGAIYPVCTLFAILATANHWVLDAVGGLVTLAVAFGVQYVLTGQRLADRAIVGFELGPLPIPRPPTSRNATGDPPQDGRRSGVTSPA